MVTKPLTSIPSGHRATDIHTQWSQGHRHSHLVVTGPLTSTPRGHRATDIHTPWSQGHRHPYPVVTGPLTSCSALFGSLTPLTNGPLSLSLSLCLSGRHPSPDKEGERGSLSITADTQSLLALFKLSVLASAWTLGWWGLLPTAHHSRPLNK